jgi:hypothetical protein
MPTHSRGALDGRALWNRAVKRGIPDLFNTRNLQHRAQHLCIYKAAIRNSWEMVEKPAEKRGQVELWILRHGSGMAAGRTAAVPIQTRPGAASPASLTFTFGQ